MISVVDLLVFKINSCGLRAVAPKRRTDAGDAEQLVRILEKQGGIRLTAAQLAVVETGLPDVVKYGDWPADYWRNKLGL